jgi:hypothetical protein
MEPITAGTNSWLGILGSVGLMLVTYVANRYIIPFLKIGKRHKFAEYITVIADEVVAELRLKYPEKGWLEHLDEAIATLARICEITPDIAERAVKASASRQ